MGMKTLRTRVDDFCYRAEFEGVWVAARLSCSEAWPSTRIGDKTPMALLAGSDAVVPGSADRSPLFRDVLAG